MPETATVKKSRHALDAREPLKWTRRFCPEGVLPYATVQWRTCTAEIKDADGAVVFVQDDCLFPDTWSALAVNIVASKYFWGRPGSSERERSLRAVISRVTGPIARWGLRDGYFASEADACAYEDDLIWLILHQHGAFNSPVWFNVGCNPSDQGWGWDPRADAVVPCDPAKDLQYTASACFILGTRDDIPSIGGRALDEMAVFKDGSGAGSDNSRIRSSHERIRGGGLASGPVSFMRVYDAVAAVTKSGGRSRRAAKMEILRCDHPDIVKFVTAKGDEEKKARALEAAGYSGGMNGEASASVGFQNSNFAIRFTDDFMRAAASGRSWQTLAVTTGEPEGADGEQMPAYDASELFDLIARKTWECGDPGGQYDEAIQDWHTCPHSGRIWGSNPCSEFLFLDDTSCNLSSLRLKKFLNADGSFDTEAFRYACRTFLVAQEILVDHAAYPTAAIARNSHTHRPLGLGYADLGALLMSMGLPYDSYEGRGTAAAITAIMQGEAAMTSIRLAAAVGPFEGFEANRAPMIRVMQKHGEHAHRGHRDARDLTTQRLALEADSMWRTIENSCQAYGFAGFRNAQLSVLAPTGTIAFMMDCDTTGVEPDLALVKYKTLAGGGRLKLINQSVPAALSTLGYAVAVIDLIVAYISQHGTIEGCGLVDRRHLPVFDCAFPPAAAKEAMAKDGIEIEGRSIAYSGHISMMAAVQPFISGAISKTVNLPESATVADIRDAYVLAWKAGLKAVAIFRDNSKAAQPMSTSAGGVAPTAASPAPPDDLTDWSDVWECLGAVSELLGVPEGERAYDLLHDRGSTELALRRLRNLAEERLRRDDAPCPPRREKLPDSRAARTFKFRVGEHKGYMHAGFHDDGRVGELFVTMDKEGSTLAGVMDAVATAVSLGLQHGVPLETFVRKFAFTTYEPKGFTNDPDVRQATSLTDYIFRKLGILYVPGYAEEMGVATRKAPSVPQDAAGAVEVGSLVEAYEDRLGALEKTLMLEAEKYDMRVRFRSDIVPVSDARPPRRAGDGPPCPLCGHVTRRAGACYACGNCGNTSGCG